MRRADEALRAAETLLQSGLLKDAVSRGYYAMFHGAEAALASENVRMPKKHSGVISLFGRQFVKTGRLNKELADDLSIAFRLRQKSDYEISADFEWESVEDLVSRAKAFLEKIREVTAE